jgi:hypothetical protein
MGHPSEGELQAHLDGEMVGVERDSLQAHLRVCPVCRSTAEAQERASTRVALGLSLLDREPSLAPEEARNRVHARLRVGNGVGSGMETARRRPGHRLSRSGISIPFLASGRSVPLPWAASIALLLTAGAVSALPGSPVREWLVQKWGGLTEAGSPAAEVETTAAPGEEDPTAPAAVDPGEIGASILADDGGVELWIRGLPAGADIRVVWIDGNMAGIFAGEGTRFRTEAGRVEAEAPPGPVRVEIPRSLGSVVVGVDGTVLLRMSGGEVDVLGPVQHRTPLEILFRPERS